MSDLVGDGDTGAYPSKINISSSDGIGRQDSTTSQPQSLIDVISNNSFLIQADYIVEFSLPMGEAK